MAWYEINPTDQSTKQTFGKARHIKNINNSPWFEKPA